MARRNSLKKRNTLRRKVSKRNRSVMKMTRRVRNRLSKRIQKGGGIRDFVADDAELAQLLATRLVSENKFYYNIKIYKGRNESKSDEKTGWMGAGISYRLLVYDTEKSETHVIMFTYSSLGDFSKLFPGVWPLPKDITTIYKAGSVYLRAHIIIQTLDAYLKGGGDLSTIFAEHDKRDYDKREIYHFSIPSLAAGSVGTAGSNVPGSVGTAESLEEREEREGKKFNQTVEQMERLISDLPDYLSPSQVKSLCENLGFPLSDKDAREMQLDRRVETIKIILWFTKKHISPILQNFHINKTQLRVAKDLDPDKGGRSVKRDTLCRIHNIPSERYEGEEEEIFWVDIIWGGNAENIKGVEYWDLRYVGNV